jgi:hypothetical protein
VEHKLEFGSSWVRDEGDEPNMLGRPPATGESESESCRRPLIVVGSSKGLGWEKIIGWMEREIEKG